MDKEQIGDAILYQGDCLEILPTLGTISTVITDPPFKISQKYTANVDADNLSSISKIWPVGLQLFNLCSEGGYFIMYYDTRILPLALEAMRWAGWKYLRGLTFYRRWGNANKLYGWMSTSDFLLLFRKPGGGTYKFYSDDWRHDVYIKKAPEKLSYNHSAQKPLENVVHITDHLSPPDGIVIDPFMGSGTTGEACMKSGRKFIGIEIDSEYFDIACKRIEQAWNIKLIEEEKDG